MQYSQCCENTTPILVAQKIHLIYNSSYSDKQGVKMSRKHFITLAKEISYISDLTARKFAALAVANAAGQHNNNFDRARFYAACGV